MTTGKVDLDEVEREFTNLKVKLFWLSEEIEPSRVGSFELLVYIHKYIFGDVSDQAGVVRNYSMNKTNEIGFEPKVDRWFIRRKKLPAAIEHLDTMPHETFDQIIEKYSYMDNIHPFKNGTGRSGRVWLDLMLKTYLNKVVDWGQIVKYDYCAAMHRAGELGDLQPIKSMIKEALTNDMKNRSLTMRNEDEEFY